VNFNVFIFLNIKIFSLIDSTPKSPPARPPPPAAAAPMMQQQQTAVPSYPMGQPNMPIPYGATMAAPYPTWSAPPIPQSFNPYATLPYPTSWANFPQGQAYPQQGPPQGYGTYPGSLTHQQQQQQQPPQGGYPQNPQNPNQFW
jgi:programmed cell death 6-interacting protein